MYCLISRRAGGTSGTRSTSKTTKIRTRRSFDHIDINTTSYHPAKLWSNLQHPRARSFAAGRLASSHLCRMPNVERRDIHRLPADLPASSRLWGSCFKAPPDDPVTIGVISAEATSTRWVITSLQRVQCSRVTFQDDLQLTTHDIQSPYLYCTPGRLTG